MATIDLNNCFPEGIDGTRKPLPKQAYLLQQAFKPDSPKYIRYIGGIGSGKTMIGCITILSWAVTYPGDYLVGRQFYPELRDTTLKTFLEITPKELIVEHRVADAIVKIKSKNGQVSNIFFRQLEEPDKLRSLNLNGFYIDESCQTTEEAFLLLQGRLRGKHVRKGLLTTNSAGHDWGWRYFVHQDLFTDEKTKQLFLNIKAPSTENVHLPADYVQTALSTWSEERVRREILADENIFEGAVYPEFRQDIHVVKPFAIPKEWTKIVGADHGFRNPSCWVWGAVDFDGNIYIYREFYQREWLIQEIVKGNSRTQEPGVLSLQGKEKIEACYMDPSVRATRGQTGISDWETYLEHLPSDFPLIGANNDVTAGIDRVKTYLKQHPISKKPRLYVFDTCKNLINEFLAYKWEERQASSKNDKESPRKFNDHAMDALRYLIMSRPENSQSLDTRRNAQWVTPQSLIQQELKSLTNPKAKESYKDWD